MTDPSMLNEPISVIVAFEVEPANQHALADAVTTFAREVLAPREGFLSATVHRSLDGAKVVNVVEWRHRADFDAYAAEPRTEPAAAAIIALARPVSTPSVVIGRVLQGA